MSGRTKFTPGCYLRSLAQVANAPEVRKFIKRSADHHHYKWDYVGALLLPLESGKFSGENLSELNFALGNLVIKLDIERSLKPGSILYLVSLYLYVSQVRPGGMQLEATAVRLALDSLVGSDDREWLELFGEFLNWLLDPKVAHRDAESYFIRLGIVIARGQISEVDESEFNYIETHLPSWVRGVKEVRLLSADPKFPQSWSRLLKKIKIRERIEPLLGLTRL